MAEDPHREEIEEDEKQLLPVLAKPDELHWWELQLGFALPKGLYTDIATGR